MGEAGSPGETGAVNVGAGRIGMADHHGDSRLHCGLDKAVHACPLRCDRHHFQASLSGFDHLLQFL